VDRAFRAVRALDDDCDIARHDHQVALAIAGEMAIADLHDSIEIDLMKRLIGDLRRAADVKVRIVSCVPGSPIDCAAMTPTASPILTGVPRARSRP
jgi:hypothetical protein